MSGTKEKVYYWDACVYLAWLKGEESHGKEHLAALRLIAQENFQMKNIIITSTITQIEVLSSKLTPDQEELFKKSFRSQYHIQYDVDPPIAQKARLFREVMLNHTSGKSLSTPDAIHMATAAIYKADELQTFDDGKKDKKSLGLLELNGDARLDGLVICKPSVAQQEIPLFASVELFDGKPALSEQERQVHAEILEIAGGMGRLKDVSYLNEAQSQIVQTLKAKGYVTLSSKNFMVILPA